MKYDSDKATSKLTPDTLIEHIGRYMQPDVFDIVLDLKRSKGNQLFDAKSNRSFLDCFTFIASNPLGFNHPKFDDPAFDEKLLRVAKTKPSNSDIYCMEMGEFVETFARVALPPGMKYSFFIDGGTLAVENAIKVAFDWKVRLNHKRGIKEERGTKIIHLQEAFHGRSGYTLSMTNTADPRKTKFFPKFEWPRVLNPKVRFPLNAQNLAAVTAAEEQSLDQIRAAIKQFDGDIAALILEPIQGEGGDNHFRKEYHKALREICDSNEIMLIYDEVQSGVGLTGKMWAHQHYDVQPDLIAFGKKMQVCGLCCSDRVDLAPDNVFHERSRINSTWGGNLTDMVRAQRILKIISEDKLVDNAATVGAVLQGELENLERKYPSLFSNARGKGLMCAIDLPSPETRDKLQKQILANGAIVLGCGRTSLRLRPSLTFNIEEVRQLIDIIERSANDET